MDNWLTQVCNAAGQLLCDKDVFALQVPVCDGRFPLCAKYLCVQVHQATSYWRCHCQALWRLHGNSLQIVIKRTILMVMGDEPQLGAGVARGHVRRHEAWEERQGRRQTEEQHIWE